MKLTKKETWIRAEGGWLGLAASFAVYGATQPNYTALIIGIICFILAIISRKQAEAAGVKL